MGKAKQPRGQQRAPKSAPEPKPEKLEQPTVLPESISDLITRFAGPLTPQRVTQIIGLRDQGLPRAMVDLVHGLRRKDGTIQAGMQALEVGVKSLQLDCVEPEHPNAKKRGKSRRAAQELKAAFADAANTPDLIAHLAGDGTLFGRGWSETIWKTVRGRMWFERFENINARRFIFRQRDAKLLFDPNSTESELTAYDLDEEFGPGKYVHYHPRVVGEDLVREGLGELACWLGLFRNWGMRDLLQTAEAAWRPRRVGTYMKGAGKEDIAAMREVLARLAAGNSGVLSEFCKIEELWNQGATAKQQHALLLDIIGREFLKAALGSSDVVEPSANGARAATQTRDLLRQDIREAHAIGISKALGSLSRAFTTLNYGPDVPAPVVLLLTEDVIDIDKFSQSIERFKKAGLPIPQSYVYDRAGIARPEGNEPLLGQTVDGKPIEEPADPKDPKSEDDGAEDDSEETAKAA